MRGATTYWDPEGEESGAMLVDCQILQGTTPGKRVVNRAKSRKRVFANADVCYSECCSSVGSLAAGRDNTAASAALASFRACSRKQKRCFEATQQLLNRKAVCDSAGGTY
jgi:hypothetical protein